jgi:predicted MFS family arabinose efflux permease
MEAVSGQNRTKRMSAAEEKPPRVTRGLTRRLLDNEQRNPKAPDAGFAWAIAFMSFLLHFVVLGTVYSFSVFFTSIRADLGISNSAASWVLSTNQCCLLAVGPFAGRAVERFGFRLVLLIAGTMYCVFMLAMSFVDDVAGLIVTFGVLVGIAGGFIFNVAIQSVIGWFKAKRAIGVGLAVSGSGIGNFVVATVAFQLIQSQGWRATIRWFALISAIVVLICGVTVRRRVFVATSAADRAANAKRALGFYRRRPFLMLFFATFFISFGYITPFLFMRPYALARGLPESDATWLLSGLGIASTVGRIVFGYIADKTSKLWSLRLSYVALGVVTLALVACDTTVKLSIFVAVFGATAGCFIALVSPVCAEYFPPELTPSLTGSVYLGAAAGNLFGPPIGGALVDAGAAASMSGGAEYYNAFYFAGTFMLAASVFLFVLPAPVAESAVPTIALKDVDCELASISDANGDSFETASE